MKGFIKLAFTATTLIYCVSSKASNETPDNLRNRWAIHLLVGEPSASNSEVKKEMNSHFSIAEREVSGVSRAGLINLSLGIGVTYYYSSDWSTSLNLIDIGSFSTSEICFVFCGPQADTRSSLKSISHYYLTQNYSVPLWNNGFAVLKAGASLTSYELNQEVRSNETGEFEETYNSKENEWGAVAGIKITHIFADSFALSFGYDKFTFLDSSNAYLELGYVF